MVEAVRVLVADDHAPTVRAARLLLEPDGYTVAAAADLDEASTLLAVDPPSLILLDAALPGGSVEEFCARIRRAHATRRIPVILLVPPRFSEERLARLRPLTDEQLFKPFHIQELRRRVNEIVAAGSPPPLGRDAVREAPAAYHFDLSGSELAGCRLERLLGRGASGAVYLARHELLDVTVAVKVMSASLAQWSPEEVQRFVRGARAAAHIQHPNVVAVLNAGTEKGFYFLVQRYVEGQTLSARIQSQGRLSEEAVMGILRDIGAGLAAAHRIGIVHRDVKPSNIIIKPGGTAVLTDFGLARAAGKGDISSGSDIVGTPYYMSPEQCSGLAIDGRSDLYSLGAAAYHALTGRRPAQGDSAIAVLRAHMEETPPAPRSLVSHLSEGLSVLIMMLLSKRPEQRYQSAEELLAALRSVASRSDEE